MSDEPENIGIAQIRKLCREQNIGISSQMETFFEDFKHTDNPASLRHHENRQNGWWLHNYSVMKLALEFNDRFSMGYDKYSIVKVVLCHDLDRVVRGCEANVLKNGKVGKNPLQYPRFEYDKGHEIESIMKARDYFSLDRMEQQAIVMHMGPYSWTMRFDTYKDKVSKFAWLIHLADHVSSQLAEETYEEEPTKYAEILKHRS